MTRNFLDRCFAFDQFGPLSIRPCHGSSWAGKKKPDRLPAACHRTRGIRYFHGCYSLGDDHLWGVNRRRTALYGTSSWAVPTTPTTRHWPGSCRTHLRWRNANARDPDVLAAQRREHANVRSERQQRWGRPRPQAA
ncbi:hypothetical protein GCM10010221_60560 [Streptomyces parvus]|uniref:hypothetical protein n=1 Tax=Streptomyces parvus TaxID=66428 RepID=UPI0019917A57|nr:hypothetical protein [Streptomyces parvus]GGS53384.1 hypothetical protein GCM10010221_60560 [Streptomyces parvus]